MKKYIEFIFAVLILVLANALSAAAQTCSPAPVGLVSWYAADGSALDSRSRNNGTLNNGAGFAAGQVGQTFDLDGTDDFLRVQGNGNLRPNVWTVESWILPRSLRPTMNGFDGVIAYGSTTGFDNGYFLGFRNEKPYAGIAHNAANTVFTEINSNATVPLNQWTHLAATFDGNALRLYVNGVQTDAVAANSSLPFYDTNADLLIGADLNQNNPSVNFNGRIDEAALYNRALSASEIAAIAGAGTAGKCKPTATISPSGQVAWFAGDGNPNDISGNSNNGTLLGGAGFAIDKVGQGFAFDGVDDAVEIPDAPSLNPTAQISFEAWVFPAATSGSPDVVATILDKEVASPFFPQYEFGRRNNAVCQSGSGGIPAGNFAFFINGISGLPNNCEGWIDGSGNLPLNVWTHVALTYDGSNVRIFINGLQTRQIAASGNLLVTNGAMHIGGRSNPDPAGKWQGRIDEVSLYDRALTQDEITSIFNAGIAGKLKDNLTPTGANVAVSAKSDATVTFPAVSVPGTTQQIPLDLNLLPALPTGSTSAGLTYDIATSAVFNGSPVVCFNLPAITDSAQFGNLRIAHLENNIWVDRTNPASINFATKTICTSSLASLSPFAVINGSASTAANVAISGRVINSAGSGIAGASLSLRDSNGAVYSARTGTFGSYRFENLPVGAIYMLSISSKRYVFADPTRVIDLNDELINEDFIAEGK